MTDLKSIIEQVEVVARDTGEFILNEAAGFTAEQARGKGINDFVSYVDIEAENRIVSRLRSILPEAGFIVEENSKLDSKDLYNWVVDPLDGTTNYIHKLPPFSISIGLTERGIPVLGIVYVLTSDEMFSAYSGGGARLNGEIISVSKTKTIEGMLVGTGFPFKDHRSLPSYLKTLEYFIRNTHGVRRMGSAAVDLAYVACGRFDSFFEYNLNPWDVTAGTLIIREAGGKVSSCDGSEDNISGQQVLATNGSVHEKVREIVSRYMTETQG